MCTPQIDGGAEADTEGVLGRPVQEVEVEVVLQLGGVQHLEGCFGDLAGGAPGGEEQLFTMRVCVCVCVHVKGTLVRNLLHS